MKLFVNIRRLFLIAAALGLALFTAIHFLYDPYRVVEEVAHSGAVYEIAAGGAAQVLADLQTVVPGTLYRVRVRARWQEVERGDPWWRTARVVFAAYNEKGGWIRATHGVCIVEGDGRGTFQEEFAVPEDSATMRLVLQHLGTAGRLRLEGYRVQVVVLRSITRGLFSFLQVCWFATVAWAAVIFQLHRRRGGILVMLSAGLIAVGMLLPDQVVINTPGAVADWVASSTVVVPRDPTPTPEVRRPVIERDPVEERVEQPPGPVQKLRGAVASRIRTVDARFWGHASLFMLLGITSGLMALAWSGRPGRRPLLLALAGGLCYAVAAELLQVTMISRTVRLYDIGINVAGLAAGVLAVGLVRWCRRGAPVES